MLPPNKPAPLPAEADAVDAVVIEALKAMTARLIRVETRLVLLMREAGLDQNGKPFNC